MLAACLFVMGTTHAMTSSDNERTPIPLITGGGFNGDDMRGATFVPFVAYYQGGFIYVSSSVEFSVVTINIEGKSKVWSSVSDISDRMGEINISDGEVGEYTIEIVTEYGECFVGSFTL